MLVVEQALEPALRNLGLIGRIGRIPAWILEHIAQNDIGRVRVVVAEADKRFTKLIFVRKAAQRR